MFLDFIKLLAIRQRRAHATAVRQKILCWENALAGVGSAEELVHYLTLKKAKFSAGKHTIYIPPQPGLSELIGEFADFYPGDAGFKILKDFTPPDTANYLVDAKSRWIARSLMGSVENLMDVANVLHTWDLGPRPYDVVELFTGRSRATCFITQHVEGTYPTPQEHRQFIEKVRNLVEGDLKNALAIIPRSGLGSADFGPPDCNKNLIKRHTDQKLLYVDFQQFVLSDREKVLRKTLEDARETFHFGGTRAYRGGSRYLYQGVPGVMVGKRDTQRRWELFCRLLRQSGVDFEGRLVMDIGCNAGLFLALSLSEGAFWGVGWDIPSVIPKAERVLSVLGNTRVLLVPAVLDEEYPLSRDIPGWLAARMSGSVVFYLATWRHMGFLSALRDIPWTALVFEGHQEDNEENWRSNVRLIEEKWACRLEAATSIVDGDCRRRPVGLFVRDHVKRYNPTLTASVAEPKLAKDVSR